MKIQAAVVTRAGQPFEVKTLELAPPGKGEVLVRIRAAGICHSDWNVRTGATEHPLPAVAGHEGAGIVESGRPGGPELGAKLRKLFLLRQAKTCSL